MRRMLIVLLLTILAMAALCLPCRAEETSKAEQRRLFREGARLWPVYCAQ